MVLLENGASFGKEMAILAQQQWEWECRVI